MEIGSILTNRYNAAAAGIVKNPLTVPKTSTSKEEVQVQISETAKNLSQIGTKQAFNDRMLNLYMSDSGLAETTAKNLAYGQDLLFVKLPESGLLKDTYYLDGTPVTDQGYKSRFESEAGAYRKQRIALYEAEKSKGTPVGQIIEKLSDFYKNLPESYHLKIGYVQEGR
ncbi:hypothetical protein [Endozoicomonas sp. 4G]|uniref:hypothetical protein n=1 Tax=Endozoicomonas sp. 4G TaxID=2872754 RepID=UPI0020788EC6|nr:hypothetical protein [Endozoicomonas sp. 4G]